MHEWIELEAADGHRLQACLARPAQAPRAGLVVLQEVFGVTDHIRQVTESFAAEGYLTLAPALFDRVRPGVDLDYTAIAEGREIMLSLQLDAVMQDIAAAAAALRSAGHVGVVGYCWGGALADLAACRLDIQAAVSYYGRMTVNWLDEKPRCPVLYHFGARDPLIPPEMVAQIRAGRPEHSFWVYPEAGHGFNCDARAEFHPQSAELARARTLRFLREELLGGPVSRDA